MITSKKRTTCFFDSRQKSWISEERGKKVSRPDFKIQLRNIAKSKRSQLFGMPFSVIFSIFLIVFFIIAAWIAISIFWNPGCDKCALSDQTQEGLFKDDLQLAIDDVWNSAGADRNFKVNLPGKIERICFMNYDSGARGEDKELFDELRKAGRGNLYLYPIKCACTGFKFITINHINITETAKTDNPLCIDNGEELWISTEHGGPVRIYKK